jgi:MFS family permease
MANAMAQTVTATTINPTSTIDYAQRRIVRTLAATQVFGGVGVATGSAVSALLAAELSSDSFAGVASAASVVGAALIAIPVSRLMDVRGRRHGLMLAYAIGIAGALTVIVAATLGWFPLLLLGLAANWGGTTATLQSRYAATDLASPERRGRSLSTVVWATTIGSVLGPNLASPMEEVADRLDIPDLAGSFVLTLLMFIVALGLITILLRPDPLLIARARRIERDGGDRHVPVKRSMRAALSLIGSIPSARVALASIMIGHAVMVGVMTMTPVHLRHADMGLRVIGVVISLHIAGMYAFSPLVGMSVDRFGRKPVIVLGACILLAACVVAGSASGHEAPQLTIGLGLLGLGWSCALIAGSTLLTDSVPAEQLPNVQGTADVLMGFGGASAGLLAGLIFGFASFGILAMVAAVLIFCLLYLALTPARMTPAERPA